MGAKSPTVKYAIPVSEKPDGSTAIYRSPEFKDRPLLNATTDGSLEMKSALINSFKKYSKNNCLGHIVRTEEEGKTKQSIQYLKYEQVLETAINLGSAIINQGLFHQPEGQKMKFIGIFSKNIRQWTITDLACLMYGLVSIPIYDTLGDENISYVFNHTNLTTVFVNGPSLKSLLKTKDMGNVKLIVCYDPYTKQEEQEFKTRNIKLELYSELIKTGEKSRVNYTEQKFNIQPLDCLTFSYTSGTTGDPKGAMLSHSNLVSVLASLENHQSVNILETDISLSYLPLPHVLERSVVYALLFAGGRVVYSCGDINKLKDDIALARPTIFVSVPRLFSKFYEAINNKFNGITGYAKSALDHGVQIKIKNTKTNGGYSHKVYDPLFFNKTKAALGGRVRIMVSGSAPIIPQVHAFMKAVMCCPLHEAYGQTESSGGSFITHSNDPQVGHVGGPVANVQYKLVDLPEMDYTSEDKDNQGRPYPRGEIWMRGPGIFLGYYKNQEKTKEAITQDGWLRSGDVGAIIPGSNALKIIDRKKNIFKLQQGEYVASQKVENVYSKFSQISEIWLHGESTQNFAIVIVVAKKSYIQQLGKQAQIQGTYEELCKSKQIRIKFLGEMNKIAKQNGLKSFQQAKNIYLETKTFLEKQVLTNTMKLQRHIAKKVYSQEINDLYSEGMLPTDKQKKQEPN